MENEMGYIVASGPEELEQVLGNLLVQSKTDEDIKANAQYILYELGSQKSMIKMDMRDWPVAFWHYDLLGRPATSTIKDVISRFAWEKCGEKEWYYQEKKKVEKTVSANGETEEEDFLDWRQQIFDGKIDKG